MRYVQNVAGSSLYKANKRGKSSIGKVWNTQLVSVLLGLFILLGFLSPLVGEIGAYYYYSKDWLISYGSTLSAVSTLLDYLQQVTFFILLIYAFCHYRQKHYAFLLICVAGFLMTLVIEQCKGEYSFIEILFGSISPNLFLIPAIIAFASDELFIDLIRKHLVKIMLVAFALTLLSVLHVRLAFGWASTVGYFPAREFVAMAFCSLLLCCFDKEAKIAFKIKLIGCLLLAVAGFILLCRSWVLQAGIISLLVALTEEGIGKKIRNTVVIAACLVLVISIVAIAFPSSIESMVGRAFDDSRSGQYEVFFNQVSWEDLVFGGGVGAAYVNFDGQADYRYFDNQIIFLAFHFGILPVILMLYVLFLAVLKAFKCRNQTFALIPLMFILAITGLSTYFSLDINLGFFILFGSMGAMINKEIGLNRE